MDVEKILFNYKTLRGRMIFENKVIEWVKDNDNSDNARFFAHFRIPGLT